MRRRGQRRTSQWWTRERVIEGLKAFHRDFGFCATSSEAYAEKSQFTGVDPVTGQFSNRGWHQKYPSFQSVLRQFETFRQAWEAAGFEVNRANEAWSTDEDWFVLESVGIIPRSEVSAYLKRTEAAIKRRLYDLGDIRSFNRWGITVHNAEKLLGLPGAVIRKYMAYGIIPYLQGNKLQYLNPADLLKVEEMDWSKPVKPEIDALIRNAVAQRVAKMAKYGDKWRDHEVYTFHKTKERFAGRIKNPRKSAFAGDMPPLPNDIAVDDWVTPVQSIKRMIHGAGERYGIVKAIHWSPLRGKRVDGTKRACWIARVEFPKIRTITNEKDRRIHHSIPLDLLFKAVAPIPEPKPLSMKPEAIRGRQRFAEGVARARKRFGEIQGELS